MTNNEEEFPWKSLPLDPRPGRRPSSQPSPSFSEMKPLPQMGDWFSSPIAKDPPATVNKRRPTTFHTMMPTSDTSRYDDYVTTAELQRVYNYVREVDRKFSSSMNELEHNSKDLKDLERKALSGIKDLQNRCVHAARYSLSPADKQKVAKSHQSSKTPL
jgi:hypothetical protein